MKILLVGSWRKNTGPANVTRSLIEHSDKDLLYLESKNKICQLVEFLIKLFQADVVLFSGTGLAILFKIAKVFGKRIALLKHGDANYENDINHLGYSHKALRNDLIEMNLADAIVCVSERYTKWVEKHYPQYKDKLTWVNNGFTLSRRSKVSKDNNVIAIGGGNRGIKNNLNVCRAVEKLNNEGANIVIKSFGRMYESNPTITSFPFVKEMGHMDKKEYYKELDKVKLFVDAAYCEPFGLSIADALICNCSVLLSDNVGFLSIVDYKDCDVVQNCDDINEIANKIQFLLKNSNSERLFQSIDTNTCSESFAYSRLKKVCLNLLSGKILR